ncbi:uncharacterized protein O3Q21_010522 [Podargus strigoides]
MATFLILVQLLFIGTLIIPGHTQTAQPGKCYLLQNATAGNFSVDAVPPTYQPNTTFVVTITHNITLILDKDVSHYLLQALTPQNVSVGEWKDVEMENCSSIDTPILNNTQRVATWISPNNNNISSVQIRAYIAFSDNSTLFSTVTLSKEPETTKAPPTTTPNSVSMVQSSSFFIAVVQVPLLLVTGKLLS